MCLRSNDADDIICSFTVEENREKLKTMRSLVINFITTAFDPLTGIGTCYFNWMELAYQDLAIIKAVRGVLPQNKHELLSLIKQDVAIYERNMDLKELKETLQPDENGDSKREKESPTKHAKAHHNADIEKTLHHQKSLIDRLDNENKAL